MIDGQLGSSWVSAPVYSDNWFGSAKTKGNYFNYRVPGRFHTTRKVYDPDGTRYPGSTHNLYGYLGNSNYDTNKSPWIQRSSEFCSMQLHQGFANCHNVRSCYSTFLSSNRSLFEFDQCVQKDIHANLHSMHAGMWNCAVDWNNFMLDHSDWANPTLLSIMATSIKGAIEKIKSNGYLYCPESCSTKDNGFIDCQCTSLFPGVKEVKDVDKLSDHAVYVVLADWWRDLYERSYQADKFISYSEVLGGHAPSRLSRKQVSKLNRLVLKTALFPGTFGGHFSGAAANDPLFWVMHQMLEKVYHGLRLSPAFSARGFVWDNSGENGGGREWTGPTPFKTSDFEPYAMHLENEGKSRTKVLTNEQLWDYLKPDGEVLPYIYDQLTVWGNCDFDPTSVEGDTDNS